MANAVQHAPGAPAIVKVDWAADWIAVTVTNTVTSPVVATQPGHGLIGMRERVEALAGELTTGVVDGIWRVNARVRPVVETQSELA